MVEKNDISKSGFSFEWLLRGSLTRLGDILDNFTRRKGAQPSSLATSQLIERLKLLLDSKVTVVPEKGKVVPHNIRLRIQWDKFATDQNDAAERLQQELLTAAIDHINDSQYYTLAPLDLQVSPDYFTDGVKLLASFDSFGDSEADGLNITVPIVNLPANAIAESIEEEPAQVLECAIRSGASPATVRLQIPSERRVTVGRSGANRFAVDDPSISKYHASISIAPDGTMSVADTGSTNGTFINGQRIAYGKSISFDDNDIVKFGAVEVSFRIMGAGKAAESGSVNETPTNSMNSTLHLEGETEKEVQ